jgi:DNA-binding NarL/FixJ family response regulator
MEGSHMAIRVLLADDYPVMCAGLRAMLDAAPDIEVVGEAHDGLEAQRLVAELQPDIVLLDLVMPDLRPVEFARWARTHYPATEVLLLTAHEQDCYLAWMIEAGAAGFLSKEEAGEMLVGAVRRAARGEVFFSREQLARAGRWREEVGQKWESLTAREREVLRLVANGRGSKQIAAALGIGEHTVETHVGSLLDKLGVASRTEASAWAWRHGVVEEDEPSGGNPSDENPGFPG